MFLLKVNENYKKSKNILIGDYSSKSLPNKIFSSSLFFVFSAISLPFMAIAYLPALLSPKFYKDVFQGNFSDSLYNLKDSWLLPKILFNTISKISIIPALILGLMVSGFEVYSMVKTIDESDDNLDIIEPFGLPVLPNSP
tara:strand:- start:2771 stop:3190 length:420 start_codon:yes stop_codon:yes gene_type:complete